MANYGAWCGRGVAIVSALMLISIAAAAPMESEEEVSGNGLGQRLELGGGVEVPSPWDTLDAATLRKILLQIDADERMAYAPRALRAWSPTQQRGWGSGGPRALDSRAVRQWRADKRQVSQVRFRQCYFNPISCFRK